MRYIKFDKLEFKDYVLVFVLIYFNTSSLAVTLNISEEVQGIGMLTLFSIIFIIKLLVNKKLKFNSKNIAVSISLVTIILISLILNSDYNILNLFILSQIMIAFIVSNIISFERFVDKYLKIMIFLSIYSLVIIYIVKPFIPNILNIFSSKINSEGLIVNDYIFSFEFIVVANRNTGIFREMGVYQIFLNIALFFEVFLVSSKARAKVIILLAITIISTFSTPGIINMLIILIAYIINSLYFKDIKKTFKVIKYVLIIIFLIIVGISFNPRIKRNMELSIMKITEKQSSYSGRTTAIKSNLKSWSESPIFGKGRTLGWQIRDEFKGITKHNTSTTTLFMTIYGLVFAIIITWSWCMVFMRIKAKLIVRLLLVIGSLISINSQALIHDQLFYVISFCIFMSREKIEDKLIIISKKIEVKS